MERNIIISLFDYTGNWSRPYRENGYEVIQVDIQHGTDILTWNYKEIERERESTAYSLPYRVRTLLYREPATLRERTQTALQSRVKGSYTKPSKLSSILTPLFG